MASESSDGSETGINGSGVMVSLFDYSIENHFRAIDTISQLCGAKVVVEEEASCASGFSSSITFLREWRSFCYRPRTVSFACEVDGPKGKDVLNDGINLPQFSAASVPKLGSLSDEAGYLKASKDSVLYVGGPVWALDWCPSLHHGSESHINCEYLAVAAHPPESSYHKIGAALTGRGVIQIWCILNVNMQEEELPPLAKSEGRGRPRKRTTIEDSVVEDKNNQSPPFKKARGRPRKSPSELKTSPCLKKARGRPRKTPAELNIKDSIGDTDRSNQILQALAVPVDQGTAEVPPPIKKRRGRPRKKMVIEKFEGDMYYNDQPVQALAVQLDERTGETSPPLSKMFRRIRKKKSVKVSSDDLFVDSETVRALAVEFPVDQPEFLAEMEPVTFSDEQALLTNLETDIVSDRGTQEDCRNTEVACKLGHMTLSTNEKMKNISRTEIHNYDKQVVSAADEQATISCGQESMARPMRKVRIKARVGIYNDDIHPCLSSECMEEESSLAVVQGTKGRGKDPKPTPKRIVKSKARARISTDDNDPQSLSKCMEGKSSVGFVQATDDDPLKTPKGKKKDIGSIDDFSLKYLEEESSADLQATQIYKKDPMMFCTNARSSDSNMPDVHLPREIALPRVVLCLAHNGKVAWDVKWRPSNITDLDGKHLMGYLAVLLGNGSLEVWAVPFPGTVKALYSSNKKENTDPRFVKLAPVFRCSKLSCGDRQSIPLTLEWSPSMPHDLILAGCHDGTVALWKFSPSDSCQDTRPLLCFSADTLPIRALAWAPEQCGTEGVNVIVTAGHGGLRFWDLRDPFHPLWDLNPGRRGIYSLDWLPDPRCIIMSFDDGTLKFMSMLKVANDVPVTGKPFSGTQQQGLHSYLCSSFPIWSVQASRLTGLVAYCGADGSVLRFQLTSKAVDKDPSRNRTPHFLCGSLRAKEDSSIEINTPLTNSPCPMKKSQNDQSDTPRSICGSDMDQAKRKNGQAPDVSKLALCYGDDSLVSHLGDETPLSVQERKSAPRPKAPDKKNPALDIVCSTEEQPENLQERRETNQGDKKGSEIDVFPSKLVAVHRVRWNMNRGSERWLCSGGAAGIVRCQEISKRSIAEGLLMKR